MYQHKEFCILVVGDSTGAGGGLDILSYLHLSYGPMDVSRQKLHGYTTGICEGKKLINFS